MAPRFLVVPAVHLLLLRDRRILLARRANTGYEDGKWSVPAGHLDGGEPVRQAAAREAAEEVGVDLDLAHVRFVHVMHRREADEERVDFFVRCERWAGRPHIAEPEKCTELTWAAATVLPRDTIPYVRHGIDRALAGDPYSEFGW